MAGETVRGRALESWRGLRATSHKPLLTRQRLTILLTFGFFVAAFLVYRLLGPPETVYNNFVRLADAFLHGRIDLGGDVPWLELIAREGKHYVIPPPMPAIVILPGVALFGLALNQTLVSAVIGAINASVVHSVVRGVSQRLTAQVWLTILFVFGTIYWHVASNGGVWFFSHTVAVLFLFLAIYVTIVHKRPFLAGLFLGAAYWTRAPTIFALPFFLIMFSDQWLTDSQEAPILRRIDVKPLVLLGLGVGIFLLLSFIYNYLRFDTPLDASQHFLPPRVLAQPWFNHGPFHMSYIGRHISVCLEKLPIFQSEAPYILPSWGGMAIWATTPAFFFALFAGIRDKRITVLGSALIFITVALIMSRAIAGAWDLGWATFSFPHRANLWPFFLLIAVAIIAGRRDKLVLACWSAIVPIMFMLSFFAGTGFAQFGYRFSLDFLPFLFLLTVKAIGDDIRWYHKLLIGLSVAINLWGVVWIYQFNQDQFLGLQWVRF